MFKRKKFVVVEVEEKSLAEDGSDVVWGKPGCMRVVRVMAFFAFVFFIMNMCGML